MESQELTFGEKAVGLTFNPSNNPAVQAIKEKFADVIDELNVQRQATEDGEVKRMLSVAITGSSEIRVGESSGGEDHA
jgi:hypothetical protein